MRQQQYYHLEFYTNNIWEQSISLLLLFKLITDAKLN